MGKEAAALEKLLEGVIPASEGAGPLLERDYWAVIRECRCSCREVALIVREHFLELPPESLVVFRRTDATEGPLDIGDELEVKIRMSGTAAVRVVHLGENSITLATIKGHPEAGRITFGAYRNERGDIIFHIRSRARSSSAVRYRGFLTAGEPMQTNTWTDFIDRLAHMVGGGVLGTIHVETRKLDEDEDREATCTPTFIARGE
jgi:hypothetical protein